jgi:hypothetical protein
VNLNKFNEREEEGIPGKGSRKYKGRKVTMSCDGFMSKRNVLLHARFSQNLFLGLGSFPW